MHTRARAHAAACPTNGIQLVGSSTKGKGRLEICYEGRWGTVCDDDWDSKDSAVVYVSLNAPTLAAHGALRKSSGAGRIQWVC